MDEQFVTRTKAEVREMRKHVKEQTRYRREFRENNLHGPLPMKMYPGYKIIAEYHLDDVLAVIPEQSVEGGEAKHQFKQWNAPITVGSDRLRMFKLKGVKCVAKCGRTGVVWRLEANGSNKPHLNLYAQDGSLMTKDHIFPKSLGGKDVLENYQPMCDVCNMRKGSKVI